MSPATIAPPADPVVPSRRTVADVLRELGDIPAHRVRMHPHPGTATETDAIRATNTGRACELIRNTLVEKAIGVPESFLASLLLQFIGPFVRTHRLGITTAPDGMYRMIHGNIREPDVSFTARARLKSVASQVADWCPDLCVEILSPSNSREEMSNKREEYFKSGCREVWIVDHRGRTVEIYSDPTTPTILKAPAVLDGGTVLPGFALSLTELFAAFDDGMRPDHD